MKRIIADINEQESRIALVENKELKEFYIEQQNYRRIVGNIYKGRVENVLPGMQAAFVNIGLEKNAFLYVRDAIKRKDELEVLPPIRQIINQGEEILVQVLKEPFAQKGPKVTTNITLPGRYIVLMPTSDYIGVSKRITEEKERERLKKLAQECKIDNMGMIIRTEAQGIDKEEFYLDLNFLINIWNDIQKKDKTTIAPKLIYRELELTYKIVRDLFTEEIDEFIINEKKHYCKVIEMVEGISPALKRKIIYFDEFMDIFDYYGLNSQIRELLQNKVWLKSGGYIVIDQTEALTVIDVNTGKFIGNTSLEDTILKTNLEAAEEIGKQLRLRDIGGIIIIDFIDMEKQENSEKVLDRLQQVLQEDRTKTNVLGITHLGLVEMTRKKQKKPIEKVLKQPCPLCEGTGRVISINSIFIEIDKILKRNSNLKAKQILYLHLHPHTIHRFKLDAIIDKLKNYYHKDFKIIEDHNIFRDKIKITK
ncbi:Rne/Rng family ribonuclease [Garciella nitratireducens]|uniref:Ribonuclease G n=1 Tax=Garciella nitratireducens DSM 15102 TaxID=1121911 RepID=A0A1T4K8Q6_9FIRM|nr:Rne/Rng family ribonuclease [Garciella nitratireducens]SJZ38814.1 ribonuclease G [Garciella nitratireducens DSM 15102]